MTLSSLRQQIGIVQQDSFYSQARFVKTLRTVI